MHIIYTHINITHHNTLARHFNTTNKTCNICFPLCLFYCTHIFSYHAFLDSLISIVRYMFCFDLLFVGAREGGVLNCVSFEVFGLNVNKK